MRLFKSYSLFVVIIGALVVNACTPEEDLCPTVDLEVEIDSANYTTHIQASGLSDLAFELFINDQLIKSFAAGELDTADLSYQFEPGEYKVCVFAQSESCDQQLEGCVEFTIDGSNKELCNDLSFSTEMIDNYYYKFTAEFDGIDTLAYSWVIDEDTVLTVPLSDNRVDFLEWDFEEGEYTVCIIAENDECGIIEYCKEIVVENTCIKEVAFEAEMENAYTYYFYADFDEKDSTKYKWYINEEIADIEIPGEEETDHKLFWQFDNGTHTVCLVTDQDGCESVEYCETIIVEGEEAQCLDLSYEAELTETDTTDFYTFTADFAGKDQITYIWKVFVDDDLQHSETREFGSEDDHSFVWHFESGVEYEICLKQDDCEDNQVCEIFAVD
ncbi:hypothetical protein [Ekhidna sp.]